MHGKESISLMKRTKFSWSVLESHMFYLYIQHRNKHEAWHLKGQIFNWSHCSNIFLCNEKQTAKAKQCKSSLSVSLVHEGAGFKSSLRAGLSVPASSRHLFLFPRDEHAQRMKPVQDEFLTIAAGHCWGPEPGPWVTVYCCGAGHLEHQMGTPSSPDDTSSASPRGVKTLQAQRQRGLEGN